jgi:Na+/melibiose symporter-like transporter
MTQYAHSRKSTATWTVITVLLAIAILGTLWVPLYARSGPKLGPIQFFYWFQLIWVPLTAVLCWICYDLSRAKPDGPAGTGVTGSGRPLCTST